MLPTLVRDVPDFPEPGVVFKDITPLLADHDGFALVVDALAASGRDDRRRRRRSTRSSGSRRAGSSWRPRSRCALGVGLRAGAQGGQAARGDVQQSYALEYGEATLEVHQDAFAAGDRVLVIDDVLATGGTVERHAHAGRARAERRSRPSRC